MKGDRIYKAALLEAAKDEPDLGYVYNLLGKAVLKKNPKAIYALGTWYLFGKFVEKDVNKAFELFLEASHANIAEACFDLAKCYEEGVGVTKSLINAYDQYLKAALLGDKQSIYEVGRCYYYGIGIKEDHRLAGVWLDIASYNGIED